MRPLGAWLSSQRDAHRKGTLREDRRERLSEAGFDFNPRGPVSENCVTWDERFDQLVRYRVEHGKDPPKRQKGLGHWCDHQCRKYREGALGQDRVNKLNQAGFTFGGIDAAKAVEKRMSNMKQFDEMYAEWVGYFEGESTCHLPSLLSSNE